MEASRPEHAVGVGWRPLAVACRVSSPQPARTDLRHKTVDPDGISDVDGALFRCGSQNIDETFVSRHAEVGETEQTTDP